MFGAVAYLQYELERDAIRFQNSHEILYADTTQGAHGAQEWSATVPHAFVELRLEDVDPEAYFDFGESVGDVIEVYIAEGILPDTDEDQLPALPARLLQPDVSSKLVSSYRLAQKVL